MKKLMILLAVIILFFTSLVLFSQDGENNQSSVTYWDTTYDYPQENVMVADLKIAKYYGGMGEVLFMADNEKVEPITSPDAKNRYLNIIHMAGGRSSLLGDDYSGDISQVATVIDELKAGAASEDTLLIDAGDHITANLQYTASQGRYEAYALNMLGFDVSTIGNNDFDFGENGLKNFIKFAKLPFVSSNLVIDRYGDLGKYSNTQLFRAYIIEKAGRNIGIVGATNEDLRYISSTKKSAYAGKLRKFLQHAVDNLIDRGVNVVIAITNIDSFDDTVDLAQRVKGVDIFVSGDDYLLGNDGSDYLSRKETDSDKLTPDKPKNTYPYEVKSKSGEPVYIVSTKADYDYVGRLQVLFDEKGLVSSIRKESSNVVAVKKDLKHNERVKSEIIDPLKKEVDYLKTRLIGKTAMKITTEKDIIAVGESSFGNYLCDALHNISQREFSSLQSRGKVYKLDFTVFNTGNLNSIQLEKNSDISIYDTVRIFTESDFLTIVKLSAENIKEIFEKSFEQLPNPSEQFLQVSSDIIVKYDPSKPAGDRVVSIKVKNYKNRGDIILYSNGNYNTQKLSFNVAMNSTMAYGGKGFTMLKNISKKRRINLGYSCQKALEEHIRQDVYVYSELEGRLIK